MQDGQKRFARIAIPFPLEEPLIYAVPPALQEGLKAGMRVLVPLGKRKVTGVVVDFVAQTSLKRVKEILALLDEKPVLDATLLKLSHWMAQYYLSPVGEVIAAMLPPSLRVESQRVAALRSDEVQVAGSLEKRIVEELKEKKGQVSVKGLARRFGGGLYRALNRLAAMGVVEVRESVRGGRRLGRQLTAESAPAPAEGTLGQQSRWLLTSEQDQALDAIRGRLRRGGFEVFLLCGVTGSGKTEVYLRAMEEAGRTQKRSLILVPEIALTPQLTDRLRERFGDRVGVLHSGLTPSERWVQWWRILRGDVAVVVGARSAIFAPVPELGLIVVDEEHDPSYKQDEGVRYQARDLAVMRGKLGGCPVLLGSATPAVESFENCRQDRYRLVELTQRVEQRLLPRVDVVDLRLDRDRDRDREARGRSGFHPKSLSVFSPVLKEALRENYARGQQSLIFLNRRGFASFLQCRLCGLVPRCPHCSVSLTFHLKRQSAICHHCGYLERVSGPCPGCGSEGLSPMGMGTEQVEEELRRLLPDARVARMDWDTTRKRGSQERLIRQWERGEIDVLVGTQMITKGHDVSGVTLVGVILADLSLNLPDFRAAERTFQLLSQVAGRAGRGKEPGRVVIQTYAPDHYIFPYVLSHDYKGFFASEGEFRCALNYPPFSRLVQLRLEGSEPGEVREKAKILAAGLRRCQREPNQQEVEILGPAPAPIEKLRGRYRWQILLKGREVSSLLELAGQARGLFLQSRSSRLYIDVDPYHML